MASFPPTKLESNTGRDLISKLPLDIKHRILECLPTRDAARTALLSTHWNDVWLHHGRLVFDSDFFEYFQEYEGDKSVLNIIDNVLSLRAGPVKKFTLDINGIDDPSPEQSDIDRWCAFLSRDGVEELNISLYYTEQRYELPDCILSGRTIKQLKLVGFFFHLPVNAGCIFPGVTSLVFDSIVFKCSVNGIASSISIPNLEKLAFGNFCHGINKFEISAPKLEILYATCYSRGVVESTWFPLHLKTIKSLCLSGSSLWCQDVATAVYMFPTAINLQVMKLYDLSFHCGKQLTVAMELLRKSPKLCELDIMAKEPSWDDDKEAASRLLEDPNGCLINQDLKMLNTVKIESFRGSKLEILFVKTLLSKSPALERVVIHKSEKTDESMDAKISSEFLSFPRASPNAQIVCMDCTWHTCELFGYPIF